MSRSTIEAAASDWIARLDSGLTTSEQAEFDRWRSDPVHARVFARHEKVWQIFSGPHAAGKAPAMMQEIKRRIARRRRRKIAALGAVAAVLLVIGFISRPFAPRERNAPAVPVTAHVVRPEQKTLPDGSIVELKAGAEISVQFSEKFRRVVLLKGDAHFRVTKNKNRPFIVAVNNIEVRAVGTAFLVQRGAADLQVLVTEGIVALDRRPEAWPTGDQSPPDPAVTPPIIATLSVGDHAVIDLAENMGTLHVDALDSATISDQLAWKSPRLEFTGTPLSEAVGVINKFNEVKIVVDDPSLAALQVSGFFRADNTDTFLRLIEQSLGVRGERKGDTIFLRKIR
jgi:transmembrane sensor